MKGQKKRSPGKHEPGYLRHRDTTRGDRAFMLLDGKRTYLGRYGTPESRAKYERLKGEWLANGRRRPCTQDEGDSPAIVEVVLAYWEHAQTYYRGEDSKPTGEAQRNIRYALRPLRDLYGDTLAKAFDTLALDAVRATMIDAGLSRKVINQRISIIRRMFRWAESKQMVPAGTFHTLKTLEPLKAGRSEAHETDDVSPVEWHHVRATLDRLPDHIAAMVTLQWETAMRPGEVVQMRACDIDRTAPDVWLYRPGQHKNKHRGKSRTVRFFGRSQAALLPFLNDCGAERNSSRFLFAPDGHRARHDRYTTTTYAQAVSRGIAAANAPGRHAAILNGVLPLVPEDTRHWIEKAVRRVTSHLDAKRLEAVLRRLADKRNLDGRAIVEAGLAQLDEHEDAVPHWSPNQLRHSAATRIARETDTETARQALDHSSLRTTSIYVKPDEQATTDKLRRLG